MGVETVSIEENEIDLRIETTFTNYSDDWGVEASITFTHSGKGVKMDYEGEFMSSIMPTMLKDIQACIEKPCEWIAEILRTGPDTVGRLRQLEEDAREYQQKAASYQKYATQYHQIAQEKQVAIAKLKTEMEQQS